MARAALMIPEPRAVTEAGAGDPLVADRPADGGELSDCATESHDDAFVLQQLAFSARIAVAAKTAAGRHHAVAGHAGRAAGPHDGADGSPGAWASGHARDVTVGGDAAGRNSAHHIQYPRFE